ncbi:MAG: hypothetical protein IKX85_05480 [Clostridia bacterium]|nr:hypothetical protein [Clostridia bacterium]
MRTELHFTLAHELFSVGGAALLGGALYLLYALLSLPRRRLPPFPAGLLDLLWCFSAALAFFFFDLSYLDGRIRLPVFLAGSAGFLLFREIFRLLRIFFKKTSSLFHKRSV